MSGRTLLRQAMRSMGRYKIRTGFMMLGSIIGVAALTFIVSVGQAAQTKMLRTIRQILGDASVLVIGGGSRMLGSPRGGVARLTIDDMAAVAREVQGIDAWDPQADLSGATVRHDDAVATPRVIGGSERWDRVWGRGVSRGTSFDGAAVSSVARVALIGETVVRRLFPGQDPIGAEIRIGAVPMRVIGVLEPYGIDMHGTDRDNEIIVPISTLMRRLTNTDAITGAKLVVTDPSQQEAVGREVRRVLRARHGLDRDQPSDFSIMTSSRVQETVATMQRVLVLYVPLVGAIVLIVGGIVSAALMLASVSERTGEIGLRRAVGARPEDIRSQFLLETAATVVTGGIVGIALGLAIVQLLESRMQLGARFSWTAVLVGLASSAIVGLAAGVAPARRAARLRPADALR
jgi:putative ABC transport system permease protein